MAYVWKSLKVEHLHKRRIYCLKLQIIRVWVGNDGTFLKSEEI